MRKAVLYHYVILSSAKENLGVIKTDEESSDGGPVFPLNYVYLLLCFFVKKMLCTSQHPVTLLA